MYTKYERKQIDAVISAEEKEFMNLTRRGNEPLDGLAFSICVLAATVLCLPLVHSFIVFLLDFTIPRAYIH